MKIYNSLTRKKEEFIPLESNKVKMYACGITVYDLSHIGHARQAIVYAMIAEYLRFRGYDVKYVRNYTDVDDKIINKANSLGKNALEFSKEQIKESEKDMSALHVKDPDMYVKASENIDNIINFVDGLIKKGYAYPTEEGNVYYIVRKFKDYGKLSNRNIDDMLNGVRKDLEKDKKDPADFALWKAAKEGEIYWKSPWGKGRPGWHIECSAMVLNYLGETIDIHGGGKDLIFPHHENEIAQSEAYTGKPFVKYWSHCGLVKINGEKMSKSLGNSLTIRDALKMYNYEVIKYVMFLKHYTSDIDLLDEDYTAAEKHLFYFYSTLERMKEYIKENLEDNQKLGEKSLANDEIGSANNSAKCINDKTNGNINNKEAQENNTLSEKIIQEFIEVMDDDFNTALALSNLFTYFKNINNMLKQKGDKEQIANELKHTTDSLKKTYGNILGIFTQEPENFIKELKNKYIQKLNIDEKYVLEKIEARKIAKQNKDYETSDNIRKELDEMGIVLMDGKEKTDWGIKQILS